MAKVPKAQIEVDVCQCIECGLVFDGNYYHACPRCESINFSSHLDIMTTFYVSYSSNDSLKIERQIRYYKESLSDGITFEVAR